MWKSKYKRVYSFARSKGILTFMSSCGSIIDILEGLIEADLKVIQMDQQKNIRVENLNRGFGDKLRLWCVDDIRRYTKKLIAVFERFNSDFIAKRYHSLQGHGQSWYKIAQCQMSLSETAPAFIKSRCILGGRRNLFSLYSWGR